VIVLAPVDGAFDEFGADLLAEIETDVASTIALVDMHVLESADSSRIDTGDDVTTVDGYAQVIEVLDVGDRQVWLLDSVLQADGTGVLPLLEIELTNSTLQVAGSNVSDEVLDAVTSIAEESGRTIELRFGSTSDDIMLDDAQVISWNAIERLLRAMIESLDTGVLTVADTGASLAGSYLDENRAASLTAVAQSVGAEVSLAPPAPLGSAEVDALNDDIVEVLIGNPVSFISGSAEFVWGSDGVLGEIAQLLVVVPGISVVVRGHTDSDGVPESNVQLSTDRAAAVSAALIDGGLERSSVSWEGVGSAEPVIIEGVEDKALSRRVEIIVSVA
jgi:outer membrane protein OmpA-like peptidoglycan-associated protein